MRQDKRQPTYEYTGLECFYCGKSSEVIGLTEHHIYPGYADRKHSPTVWLCWRCHRRAHLDRKFLELIQQLYKKNNKGDKKYGYSPQPNHSKNSS